MKQDVTLRQVLTDALEAAAPYNAPQLVALTGYGLPEDRAATASAGFPRHLTKPVSADAVEALLSQAAKAKRVDHQ